MYDIIIIGAGPAGLSAAIYGVRAGKTVLVLEGKTYGGQIVNTPKIENYPGIRRMSGFEFATGLYRQAKELGAEIKMEKALAIEAADAGTKKAEKSYDMEAAEKEESMAAEGETLNGAQSLFTVTTSKGAYKGGALILALGAKNRLLGLPREKELTGAGISYCATCDGMFYREKRVAVNGGGSTALEDALFLSDYCKEVSLIHRRDSFRGERKLLEALKQKANVRFLLNSVVTGLVGDEQLTGIQLRSADGTQKTLMCDALFVAIGQEPETALVRELIAIDEQGYILADESCKTNIDGIFAAGDCRTKPVRQLTTAAADGAVAACMAAEYLSAGH